ncbi:MULTISPECIES: rod shape-determining protein MreD [Bacillaceae]|uniref:Rod shape-determining protein MreD n=1 Tax=Peribacillus huizhouensis TaxID=1501239 RepID=A0ABR6CL57_9BACI|nr:MULTISPECIES: rod shape-determining protein MreD [Bacillaceae]MBA9025727.1 rod shape-determining protein MreD [Peribacillus huizhouensis]
MKRLKLPLTALLFFIMEGSFSNLLAGDIFGGDKIIVPRFIMILIAFITIYGTRRNGMIYGFILGLMYDVVYTEILGVYMFMLPFFAYLIAKIMRILQSNLLVTILTSLLFITFLEVIVYQINILIGFAHIDFNTFWKSRLVPTLLLNLAFLVVFSYPLKRMIEKQKLESDGE